MCGWQGAIASRDTVMLSLDLALPATQHLGIDPSLTRSLCDPIAMFRYPTDRFLPEFCCVLTSLEILHRTPPDPYLTTLIKVSVFIKPHQLTPRPPFPAMAA